jgi:hypothetical protein
LLAVDCALTQLGPIVAATLKKNVPSPSAPVVDGDVVEVPVNVYVPATLVAR